MRQMSQVSREARERVKKWLRIGQKAYEIHNIQKYPRRSAGAKIKLKRRQKKKKMTEEIDEEEEMVAFIPLWGMLEMVAFKRGLRGIGAEV